MTWRLSATKGFDHKNISGSSKYHIKQLARRLRRQGYKVTIYEVDKL